MYSFFGFVDLLLMAMEGFLLYEVVREGMQLADLIQETGPPAAPVSLPPNHFPLIPIIPIIPAIQDVFVPGTKTKFPALPSPPIPVDCRRLGRLTGPMVFESIPGWFWGPKISQDPDGRVCLKGWLASAGKPMGRDPPSAKLEFTEPTAGGRFDPLANQCIS